MKKLLILSLLLPAVTFAHGGVSKNVGNTIVYLNQTPLSPLVGENVEFAFSLTDSKNTQLKDLPVELDLIDTYFGDASKDQTLLIKNLKTDENGTLVFNYKFPKENYFDIELKYFDPASNQTNQTGFLVQPRVTSSRYQNWYQYAVIGVITLIAGLIIGKKSK